MVSTESDLLLCDIHTPRGWHHGTWAVGGRGKHAVCFAARSSRLPRSRTGYKRSLKSNSDSERWGQKPQCSNSLTDLPGNFLVGDSWPWAISLTRSLTDLLTAISFPPPQVFQLDYIFSLYTKLQRWYYLSHTKVRAGLIRTWFQDRPQTEMLNNDCPLMSIVHEPFYKSSSGSFLILLQKIKEMLAHSHLYVIIFKYNNPRDF